MIKSNIENHEAELIDGTSERVLHVAVCADTNIEVGLHVTLYSLLESSSSYIIIHFIHEGYDERRISLLHSTLAPFNGKYELVCKEFDSGVFRRYRGLHGNKFAFTRIMLANILDINRVIYLDSDLLVKKDLTELYYRDLGENVVGVSGLTTIEWSLEKTFFEKLGLEKDKAYFNSGVMLIDLQTWREHELTNRCIEFAEQYSGDLLTADQTILNYIFYPEQFLVIDESYNMQLTARSNTLLPTETGSIYHFVGSPKPWDIFAEFIHPNFAIFNATLYKTQFRNYKTYRDLSLRKINRLVRISSSYLRLLRIRIQRFFINKL